jgi:hypothetical protein
VPRPTLKMAGIAMSQGLHKFMPGGESFLMEGRGRINKFIDSLGTFQEHLSLSIHLAIG